MLKIPWRKAKHEISWDQSFYLADLLLKFRDPIILDKPSQAFLKLHQKLSAKAKQDEHTLSSCRLNLENIVAAYCQCHALGVGKDIMAKALVVPDRDGALGELKATQVDLFSHKLADIWFVWTLTDLRWSCPSSRTAIA